MKPFEKLPPFYKQVIEGYVQCNAPYTSGSHSNDNTVNVLNMCIWGNRNIRNKTGDILYFPNWIRSGMVQIKDLNIIEGKINENYIFTKLSHKPNYLSEMYQVKQGLHDFLSDNITCSVDTFSTKNMQRRQRHLVNCTIVLSHKSFFLYYQNHIPTSKIYLI